jgi:hypothetical protein
VYSAIDAVGSPAVFDFSATADGREVRQGEVFTEPAVPLTFSARVNARADGVITLRKDGRIVEQGPLPTLTRESAGEGTYRIEVDLSNAPGEPPIPWIVSNPIYVRPPGWGTPAATVATPPTITRSAQGGPWHVERDDTSQGQIVQKDPPTGPVQFTFRLGAGERTGKYAALGIGVGKGLTERTHVAFRAQASQPMRVSVQARQPRSGRRWQRSIYLDSAPRDVVIRFADMRPVGSIGTFDPAIADTLLFVVDATNTAPGTAGSFTISDLQVQR